MELPLTDENGLKSFQGSVVKKATKLMTKALTVAIKLFFDATFQKWKTSLTTAGVDLSSIVILPLGSGNITLADSAVAVAAKEAEFIAAIESAAQQ